MDLVRVAHLTLVILQVERLEVIPDRPGQRGKPFVLADKDERTLVLVGEDHPIHGAAETANRPLDLGRGRGLGYFKVHPKGRKGDILILPFQAAPHSDLVGPVAGVGAKQFGGPEDPFVKNSLYSLGLFAHRGGKWNVPK
jgi:hypothetical protein